MNSDVFFFGIFEDGWTSLHDERHAFANSQDVLVVRFRQDKFLRLSRSFNRLGGDLLGLFRQLVGLRWIGYLAEREFDPFGRFARLVGCPMPLVEPWTNKGGQRR